MWPLTADPRRFDPLALFVKYCEEMVYACQITTYEAGRDATEGQTCAFVANSVADRRLRLVQSEVGFTDLGVSHSLFRHMTWYLQTRRPIVVMIKLVGRAASQSVTLFPREACEVTSQRMPVVWTDAPSILAQEWRFFVPVFNVRSVEEIGAL